MHLNRLAVYSPYTPSAAHPLFVYGTLKQGHAAHSLLQSCHFLGTAYLHHALLFDLGNYPALVLNPSTPHGVWGELYQLPDHPATYQQRLTALHQFEEYNPLCSVQSLYVPTHIHVELQQATAHKNTPHNAWAYVYQPKLPSHARLIDAGIY